MVQPMLVGDIGGTNVRLAVANKTPAGLRHLANRWSAPTSDYPGFTDALTAFLADNKLAGPPSRAVLAIAGPIDFNTVRLTNNPWVMRRDDLIADFGFEDVTFMNDFAAMARSVPELPHTAFVTLQEGRVPSVQHDHTITVAGAGTGLGQATLHQLGETWRVSPTEGGHQPFAPITAEEDAILKALRRQSGYVSYEDICSGAGLLRLYRLLCGRAGRDAEFTTAKQVTECAADGNKICLTACYFASDALLSFVGNAVLSSGAWDGAVIAGGVSNHLLPYLRREDALDRFWSKGPMSERMKNVPLRVLTDSAAPLVGAASSQGF